MRRPGSQSELERNRLLAAEMFDQHLDVPLIAKILGSDDQTVRRWRRVYKAKGRQGLMSKKHPGRASRLNDGQKQQLSLLLLKTPLECGFDKYLWTQQLIADLIVREFGVSYHHDYIGVLMHELGFTHQKPARRARERDEARIESWRHEVWPALQKKAKRAAG